MTIGVYTSSLHGHRKSYLDFVLKNFSSKKIEKRELFTSSDTVLFLMIEDSFPFYFAACLWRGLIGKKTSGLLFRPQPVVEAHSLRLKLKKWLLLVLKKIPNVKTILIIPDSLHSGFPGISDGWIYDFQFWDIQQSDYQLFLDLKNGKYINPLFARIKNGRNNRRVLCAIGRQNRIKGFDVFVNAYIDNEDIREKFLFVYGGKVIEHEELAVIFDRIGGVSENAYISTDDIIALYSSCDLVWALYAEDYDQASGIFGRAVQFGIPVVVRKNSLIHKICELEGISHVTMSKDHVGDLARLSLESINLEQGKQFRERFRKISIRQLSETLGVEVSSE